ncbi:MAG: hypothetical protein JXA18_03745 [Chitinispirillaceae bacterium]|nr:hypothetical protein [Chitinispirillaceae bacterium]
MKKTVENSEELLKQLALGGDPHAFFLLGESYFRARYLKERGSGATHQDAQTRILADAMELLESLQHIAPARFDAWFEEHCTVGTGTGQDNKQETTVDKKLSVETAAFLNRCSRELLCMGSDIKRVRQRRRRRLPDALFRNKIVVCCGIILAVAAFFFAVTMLMVRFQTAVAISLDTPGRQFSLRFPPMAMVDRESDTLSLPGSALPDAGTTLPTAPPSGAASQTDASPTGFMPPGKSKPVSPTPEVKRSLPPVVPRARMILPPMPSQSIEPPQSTGPVTNDSADVPSTSMPHSTTRTPQQEPASTY